MHGGISPDDDAGDHVTEHAGDENHNVNEGDRQHEFRRQMLRSPDRLQILGLVQVHQFRDVVDPHEISARKFHISRVLAARSFVFSPSQYHRSNSL